MDCGCNYSYNCEFHSEIYALQAQNSRLEERVVELESKATQLEAKWDKINEQLEQALSRLAALDQRTRGMVRC